MCNTNHKYDKLLQMSPRRPTSIQNVTGYYKQFTHKKQLLWKDDLSTKCVIKEKQTRTTVKCPFGVLVKIKKLDNTFLEKQAGSYIAKRKVKWYNLSEWQISTFSQNYKCTYPWPSKSTASIYSDMLSNVQNFIYTYMCVYVIYTMYVLYNI